MIWKEYPHMREVIADIPNSSGAQYADHAIPDVYGKMLQLYFALYDSNDQRKYGTNEVRLWRGLITLIALQQHLRLPLFWEKVVVPESNSGATGNMLDMALQRPPQEPGRMLFPCKRRSGMGRNFMFSNGSAKTNRRQICCFTPLLHWFTPWLIGAQFSAFLKK